jgi:NAD(P)H-hydrate repair Nnr-like enzyme with NAD(P)H-hydrate epimerase domain
MTKQLVKYDFNGTEVLVEIEEPQTGVEPASQLNKIDRTFDAAFSQIKPAMTAVVDKLNELNAQTVAVTFGIKLSANAGAFIASAGVEANFCVTLTWQKQI